MANIIRDRKDDLVRVFSSALDQAAKALDDNSDLDGLVPRFLARLDFSFPNGEHLIAIPEVDLVRETPETDVKAVVVDASV
jgi:hypothetical protein